jgi:hypothetical protein
MGWVRSGFTPQMDTTNTQASENQGIKKTSSEIRKSSIAVIAFLPSGTLGMESCAVHHFLSVYLGIAPYGDIGQQAFIGQAIKVWEVYEAFRRLTKNT